MREVVMKEYIVKCPCCNSDIKITVGGDNDEIVTSFLFNERVSRKDVFENKNIELGIVEKGGEQ